MINGNQHRSAPELTRNSAPKQAGRAQTTNRLISPLGRIAEEIERAETRILRTALSCLTVRGVAALAVSDLARVNDSIRSKVQFRSARKQKAALPRVGERRARRPKVSAREQRKKSQLRKEGLVQKKYHSAKGQWPNWPDPLDFHEVSEEEAIARVNAAGYFLHTLDGGIYKINAAGSITAQKPSGFNNVFACRLARYRDGKLISAGVAWRRSTNHREYRQIGYWPDDHDRPAKSYNLWRGWGAEPKRGDWSIVHDHILNIIADGDKDNASYILDWCAHIVQRPWEKPGVALVLKGKKGTGKTLLTHILARVIGRQNALITADGEGLFARFNWHVADKLLIGAEEAFFGNKRDLNDRLKHLLTGDEIEVEQKFGHRISMRSMHRMIMTSNHANVIEMSDDERRFFVCEVSDKRRGDDSYFAPLWRVANGEDDVALAAFMYELKTRDITNWNPEQAARNAAAVFQRRRCSTTWRSSNAVAERAHVAASRR